MLYCVGAGLKASHLPLGAYEMLGKARWFLQSGRMPLCYLLRERAFEYETLDELYEMSTDFDELNASIAKTLTNAALIGDVVFAAIGSGVYGGLLGAMLGEAKRLDVKIELMPGISYASAAMAASDRMYDQRGGIRIMQALGISSHRQDASLPMAIEEISDAYTASDVKLWLLETYREDTELLFAKANADGDYSVKAIPLRELDRQEYDHTAVALTPPCEAIAQARWGMDGLEAIVEKLRAPTGCPWDREQTHETLKICLLEECYEVLDAIESGEGGALCEELGDLLLQVALHAQIADEAGEFTLRDVCTGICSKLIYRHPHVFGDVKAENSGEVLRNWDQLKKVEKNLNTAADTLMSVPRNLPALLRAKKVQQKAARVGFDWEEALSALEKVEEETNELREELKSGENTSFELGDLLFSAVNVARLLNVEPELALAETTDRFIERFELMEKLIEQDEKRFADMTLVEMDEYWEKAKREIASR